MPHFKLTLAYDGTAFVGWQRQASGVSIQGALEEALAAFDAAPVTVFGAGRTDAGVHARGQVASVTLSRDCDAPTVVRAANARLPGAIRVLDAIAMPPGFHARFDARSKTYRYRIWNGDVLDPFEQAYVWHVPGPLDVEAMSAAALLLEGRHDFAAFQTAGAETTTTVREAFSSRLSGHAPLLVYEIRGDGFLRHMVRGIVGTLIDVGRGRHPAAWMRDVLTSRTRAAAGRTAPATGLFLVRVDYE